MRLAAALLVCTALARGQSVTFEYDRSRPLEIQRIHSENRGGARVEDITFANLAGGRTV